MQGEQVQTTVPYQYAVEAQESYQFSKFSSVNLDDFSNLKNSSRGKKKVLGEKSKEVWQSQEDKTKDKIYV